jgi:two-component system, sensor histidine kinase
LTNKLSFFNWSLAKLLATEDNSFNKAKIKILYLFLLVSILKILVVIPFAWKHGQQLQLVRALILLVTNVSLLKLMLTGKSYVYAFTHILIIIGLVVVGTNIFLVAQNINILTMQFVFMLILSSFYLLDIKFGLLYSVVSALMILVFLFVSVNSDNGFQLNISSQEVPVSAGLIITVLNFVTIIGAHCLYHQAFNINLAEKQELNNELRVAVMEAKKNAASKSEFLSTMSHELRTPLNSVMGISELLLQNPGNDEQKRNIEILRFSAQGLNTLINDILDFNIFNRHIIELEKTNINLSVLMQNICSGLELKAKEKGLHFVLNIDSAVNDIQVFTDPVRLSQVIYNLLDNGIKFTKSGKIELSLKELKRQDKHIQIRFSVEDTGIGIDPAKHQQIFEPFRHESVKSARQYGGMGLGLPIVKNLLSLFGSEIHLESIPDKGSKFFFDIEMEVNNNSPQQLISQTSLNGMKILLTEDNNINTFLVKKMVQKWNVDLDIAENGAEALKLVESKSFDIILMDIHLPDIQGYEVIKMIRNMTDKIKSNTPIIAISATLQSELKEYISTGNINDYILKPFNSYQLYNKIEKYSLVKIHSTSVL